ncbi:MAG: NADH-quinone oxidoreductase subunit H, partial [Pirellulales bacterium]|nr:NADH-quinone oxidoreductase subunit H [Pirellulales bacterium]
MTALLPSPETIAALVKIGLLVGGLMTAAAYLVLVERWIAAWVQDRRGPNRVGIPLTKIRLFGLGQPLADGLKIIFKEDFTPRHVDKVLYNAAPLALLTASLAIFAAIPFGSVLPPLNIPGLPDPVPFLVAPGLDVGVLWVFALSSIAVYGVLLGGWASNNKYGFLGGLRSSAQLVAYEIPLGLGLLGVVLAAGSLQLDIIMNKQAETGLWYAFTQPLGFVVFLIASFAEAARLPFDLPEAEQE